MVDILQILWSANGIVYFLIGLLLIQIEKASKRGVFLFLLIASFIISGINFLMLSSGFIQFNDISKIRDAAFLVVAVILFILIYQEDNRMRGGGGDSLFKKIFKIK